MAALTYARMSPDSVEEQTSAALTIDWDRVLVIAADWDVEPVVLSNLSRLFSSAMPEDVRSRVQLRETEVRGWAIAKSLVTAELAMSLESAGVQTIVLKGPTVGLLAYGDVSMRTFSDIDLLVRPDDLAATIMHLISRGYKRDYDISLEPTLKEHLHALEFSDGKHKVEVHPALLPRHLHFDIGWSEIISRSQRLSIGNGEVSALASDQMLVFLCAHGAKHMWSGARWIADVANLIGRLSNDDVEGAERLSRRTHSRQLLSLGLRIAERELKCDVSMFSGFLSGANTPFDLNKTWLGLFDRVHPNVPALRYWIESRERMIDRLMCIASVLFSPTEKDKGPGIMRWLHRPLRIGTRSIRRIRF